MRRELCKLYVTTTEGLTQATSTLQSYFASLQESVVMAKGIGKARGGKKEGGRGGWRGKWGLKV